MRFPPIRPLRTTILAISLAVAASGCMKAGVGETLRVDAPGLDLMSTGSIAPGRDVASPAIAPTDGFAPHSDEATVASAVVEAMLSDTGGAQGAGGLYPWANPITGSTGVISEFRDDDRAASGPCRAFTTTIHRYDGIALFEGRACATEAGLWQMTSLAPRS